MIFESKQCRTSNEHIDQTTALIRADGYALLNKPSRNETFRQMRKSDMIVSDPSRDVEDVYH